MDEFPHWSDTNNLVHLPRGSDYTWSIGRDGAHHTKKRLDRVITNQNMLNIFSYISCSTLTRIRSDHFPLVLEIKLHNITYISNFKFLKMWFYHNDCSNYINSVWNKQVFGSPIQILSQKLKLLKGELKTRNKNIFENIHTLVKNSMQKLDFIQDEINIYGYNDSLMKQEKDANIELEAPLNMEEAYWSEKARIKWHSEGDRNTAYFHRTAKIKQAYKKITTLRVDDNIISDQDQIANHVVSHFSNENVVQDSGIIEDVIPSLVIDDTNKLLTMLPLREEIHNAVFIMKKDSSPGPDGFGAFFF